MTREEKAREYSEQRILAIPADVNEDGEVFYLNSDLGTADDGHNGLSGEIEMAYLNGMGAEGLRVKGFLEKKRNEVMNNPYSGHCSSDIKLLDEIINEFFKKE